VSIQTNIKQDEGGFFLVTFPDISFPATDGESLKEALVAAEDCLEEAIAACITDGSAIPEASPAKKGQYAILLSAQTSAKASLHIAVREEGISKSELSRRLGVDEKEVRRILSPKHQTKLQRIEHALGLLDRRLVVFMKKAA
jgi:antitoxin HicB